MQGKIHFYGGNGMDEITMEIKLVPTADNRHDLDIETKGITMDEVPACLQWVLHQLQINKHKKFKLIKGG